MLPESLSPRHGVYSVCGWRGRALDKYGHYEYAKIRNSEQLIRSGPAD